MRNSCTKVAFSLVYKVGIIYQEYRIFSWSATFFFPPVFLVNFMNTESSEYGCIRVKILERPEMICNSNACPEHAEWRE